jgi:Mrp family chromosome partitioning ATPase
MTLLQSRETAVHLVTVLEDMPVQETADGIEQLRAAKVPIGGVFVNLARPDDLGKGARNKAIKGNLPKKQIEDGLVAAGIRSTPKLADALLSEARDHAERRVLEDDQRKLIRALDVATYELPRLTDGVDLGGLYELAAELCEQGIS